MSKDIDVLKDEEKEKLILEEVDFEPSIKHNNGNGAVSTCKKNDNWVGGMVLIAIGAVFLLTNITNIYINNWWALFILFPAVAKLIGSIRDYKSDGRFSNRVRGEFTWGLILALVACTFLFNWSWGLIWPVFIIIFGIGALLTGLLD